jgi:hypothetical protein
MEQQVYGWVERTSQAASCTIVLKDKRFLCFLELYYEFNCCAFYFVYENEFMLLYLNLLVAFMLF